MNSPSPHRIRVGFQGVRGAYSEMAVAKYFQGRDFELEPRPKFEDVYQDLTSGRTSDAILPFENSIAGMVHENFDLIERYPVFISGEIVLPIEHCLLIKSGGSLASVKRVISHPQALAQCSAYLQKQGWKAEDYYDTAGAAEALASEAPSDRAAIASAGAAQLYGLEIAARGISDRPQNLTRFYHVSLQQRAPSPRASAGLSTLLLLRASAKLGPICRAFDQSGIEVVHAEARPNKDEPWRYRVFIEVQASDLHPQWKAALSRLEANEVRVLGSYLSSRFAALK